MRNATFGGQQVLRIGYSCDKQLVDCVSVRLHIVAGTGEWGTLDTQEIAVTLLDADQTTAASAAFHDAPACPVCGAASDRQQVSLVVQDGALELTVLSCGTCGHEHPVWS